jgi:short-subunit dehydrogenase
MATEFVLQGLEYVILLLRDTQRLETTEAVVTSAINVEVNVNTVAVDLSSSDSVEDALHQVDLITRTIDVVIYNAARVATTPMFNTAVVDVKSDFRVCNPNSIESLRS